MNLPTNPRRTQKSPRETQRQALLKNRIEAKNQEGATIRGTENRVQLIRRLTIWKKLRKRLKMGTSREPNTLLIPMKAPKLIIPVVKEFLLQDQAINCPKSVSCPK